MRIPDNAFLSVKKFFADELNSLLDEGEIVIYFYLLAMHYLGKSKIALLSEPNFRLSESELLHFTKAIKRIKNEEPIQYIIGESEFMGINLKVNPSVLIPRPETEQLVELCLKENSNSVQKVIDICTGSGCIALALKHYRPTWNVSAIDNDDDALITAKSNADILKLDIEIFKADVLSNLKNTIQENFDLITANPPYVLRREADSMNNNVLKFEPHVALFVPDDDALLFYQHILDFAANRLNKNGSIYLEINEMKGKETLALFDVNLFDEIKLIKDFNGKDRIVTAKRK